MTEFKVESVGILAEPRPPHKVLSDEERRRHNEERRRRKLASREASVPSNERAEREGRDASSEKTGNSGGMGGDAGTEPSSIDDWA